jgi:hypothetical protein
MLPSPLVVVADSPPPTSTARTPGSSRGCSSGAAMRRAARSGREPRSVAPRQPRSYALSLEGGRLVSRVAAVGSRDQSAADRRVARHSWLSATAAVVLVALAAALGIAVSAGAGAAPGSARASDRSIWWWASRQSPSSSSARSICSPGRSVLPGETLARLAKPGHRLGRAGLRGLTLGSPVVGTTAFVTRNGATPLAHGRVFATAGGAVVGADARSAGRALHPTAHGAPTGAAERDDDTLHHGVQYRVVGMLAVRHTVGPRDHRPDRGRVAAARATHRPPARIRPDRPAVGAGPSGASRSSSRRRRWAATGSAARFARATAWRSFRARCWWSSRHARRRA